MNRPVPPMPKELPAAAKDLWQGLASDVVAVAGGAEIDLLLLADMVRVRQRLLEVSETLNKEGLTVEGSKGQKRPHPLLSVEGALQRDFAAGMDRLGLSPGTRNAHLNRVEPDGRLSSAYAY